MRMCLELHCLGTRSKFPKIHIMCVFKSSVKRFIRTFHVVLEQRATKVQHEVWHMQNCCLADFIQVFFFFFIALSWFSIILVVA